MSFLPHDSCAMEHTNRIPALSDQQLSQLDEFATFMVEANRTHNLTRITEPEAIVTLHILDSLTTLRPLMFERTRLW